MSEQSELTGRALDAEVATRIMGWSDVVLDAYVNYGAGRDACGWGPEGTVGYYGTRRRWIPFYSTRIEDAWQVVEAIRARCLFTRRRTFAETLRRLASKRAGCVEGTEMSWPDVLFHLTPELICRAALAATEGRNPAVPLVCVWCEQPIGEAVAFIRLGGTCVDDSQVAAHAECDLRARSGWQTVD